MDVTDIQFKGYADLNNCESEPIHIPGSIQPHGVLLGIQLPDYTITYCSGNVADFFGIAPEAMLNRHFAKVFDQALYDEMLAHIASAGYAQEQPFRLCWKEVCYNAGLHLSGDTLIAEIEPLPDGSMSIPNLYTHTRHFVEFMENSGNSLKSLCQYVAAETRSITGYDRVMVYRFDKDYNGEVYAESRRDDLEPFLGHNYPHTDIPAQARELYLRNLMRMIADVHYAPTPIFTRQPGKNHQSLDLSLSTLRSVSPIHIEYLKNMGVGATLTISLIQNKKLWGLISCHHYTPRLIPYYTRLAAKLQGHFLTSQIAVRETAEEHEISVYAEDLLHTLMEQVNAKTDFLPELLSDKNFLDIVRADGAVIVHEGNYYAAGHVPPEAEMKKLVAWLGRHATAAGFYQTSRLADAYPDGEAIKDTASGLMYCGYAKATSSCTIWFRQEMRQAVNWAGHPVTKDEAAVPAKMLTPRKSFELWQEEVRLQSREWRPAELNAGYKLANHIQKQLALYQARAGEDRYRAISERLQLANDELEQFAYIASHDLQEPLRKINMFTDMLRKTVEGAGSKPQAYFEKITQSSSRMSRLINDVLEYSRLGRQGEQFVSVDLNDVLQIVLNDFELSVEEKGARVVICEMPVVPGNSQQLTQLFSNLLSNALKFNKGNPVIEITAEPVDTAEMVLLTQLNPARNYTRISVQDNGIGFDKEFEEKIFTIFQRLHNRTTYSGTGIGLAICRKIVEKHDGFISASSNPSLAGGATFTIYLPV